MRGTADPRGRFDLAVAPIRAPSLLSTKGARSIAPEPLSARRPLPLGAAIAAAAGASLVGVGVLVHTLWRPLEGSWWILLLGAFLRTVGMLLLRDRPA